MGQVPYQTNPEMDRSVMLDRTNNRGLYHKTHKTVGVKKSPLIRCLKRASRVFTRTWSICFLVCSTLLSQLTNSTEYRRSWEANSRSTTIPTLEYGSSNQPPDAPPYPPTLHTAPAATLRTWRVRPNNSQNKSNNCWSGGKASRGEVSAKKAN